MRSFMDNYRGAIQSFKSGVLGQSLGSHVIGHGVTVLVGHEVPHCTREHNPG